ncbi:MAG: cupin domain-containing protein [Pseudomonadota bacterium]
MELNADFAQRVVVRDAENPWRASPAPGVARKMLDRVGDEVARATSIVRFDPESAFAPHTHDGGEEYIVLEGVFQDEYGDFPVGSYVRNPPTSAHRPASKPGCTIFVKLWQFDPKDREHVVQDMASATLDKDPARDGVAVSVLFEDASERVTLERWEQGASHHLSTGGGAEVLVLEGQIEEGGDTLTPRDWVRLPVGHDGVLTAGGAGALLWVKTGHLNHVHTPPG